MFFPRTRAIKALRCSELSRSIFVACPGASWLSERAMIQNLREIDGQHITESKGRAYDELIVEPTKQKAAIVVNALHSDPHPFAVATLVIREFDLHMVAKFELACAPFHDANSIIGGRRNLP
jgi:hypothetical protein